MHLRILGKKVAILYRIRRTSKTVQKIQEYRIASEMQPGCNLYWCVTLWVHICRPATSTKDCNFGYWLCSFGSSGSTLTYSTSPLSLSSRKSASHLKSNCQFVRCSSPKMFQLSNLDRHVKGAKPDAAASEIPLPTRHPRRTISRHDQAGSSLR